MHTDEGIESNLLPPGQFSTISPGGNDATLALYRLEATAGLGGGVKMLNAPVAAGFRESVRYGEHTPYRELRSWSANAIHACTSFRCICAP